MDESDGELHTKSNLRAINSLKINGQNNPFRVDDALSDGGEREVKLNTHASSK
jgi:hypothetical protein